jgi:hypothetical protein
VQGVYKRCDSGRPSQTAGTEETTGVRAQFFVKFLLGTLPRLALEIWITVKTVNEPGNEGLE